MAIGRIMRRYSKSAMPAKCKAYKRGDIQGSLPKQKFSDIDHVDLTFVSPLTGGPGATVRKRSSKKNRGFDTVVD